MLNGALALAEKDVEANAAAELLKALAHPCRLRVLCALVEGERCVGDLQKRMSFSQSTLSQHLARLRADGLVDTRRDAQTIYYRIHSLEAVAVVRTLANLFCSPTTKRKRVCHEH